MPEYSLRRAKQQLQNVDVSLRETLEKVGVFKALAERGPTIRGFEPSLTLRATLETASTRDWSGSADQVSWLPRQSRLVRARPR
jgi:hypothetical protein